LSGGTPINEWAQLKFSVDALKIMSGLTQNYEWATQNNERAHSNLSVDALKLGMNLTQICEWEKQKNKK
jgi:hypothetical protein